MDGGWGMGAYLVTTTLLRASHALRFWILESWSEYNCDLEEAGLGLGVGDVEPYALPLSIPCVQIARTSAAPWALTVSAALTRVPAVSTMSISCAYQSRD